MLKFEHSGNGVHCEAGGNVVEICADVQMCIGILHKSMHDKDEKLASGFRRMLVQYLVDDDCPVAKRLGENGFCSAGERRDNNG